MKGRIAMSEAASLHMENVQKGRHRSTTLRRSALITAGALTLFGLSRRSKSGVALAAAGGLLSFLGVRAASRQREFIARSSMLLNCSPEEAYKFWRDFENLPLFMRHLESVKVISENRSRWIALGPLDKRITWEAEIVADRTNEAIAWRSLPDSDINVDGVVNFRTAPGDRGTLLTVAVVYQPPAGALGRALARILGKDPGFLMRQDLRRMKALIEAGEIPTVEGQSHGPRSGVAAMARALNPDEPIRGEARLREVLAARRRAS
jgi:uncharacterized membrane protein